MSSMSVVQLQVPEKGESLNRASVALPLFELEKTEEVCKHRVFSPCFSSVLKIDTDEGPGH
jgi:hypothetical protein